MLFYQQLLGRGCCNRHSGPLDSIKDDGRHLFIQKCRKMARFVSFRGTVNHSSMFLSPECVSTGSPRVAIAAAILLCWFCTSSAFAEPGVVVGSYSKQSNAEAAAQTARDKLLNQGLMSRCGSYRLRQQVRRPRQRQRGRVAAAVWSWCTRIVAPSASPRLRDAWYLAQTGASAATRTERAISQRAVRLGSHTNVNLGPSKTSPATKAIRSRR